MIKTFITGIVIGVAGVIAALHALPAVDLDREISIIAVTPNGGNAESFHINIPMDRIVSGDPGGNRNLPKDLAWPDNEIFAGARAEVFKLRNSRNAVVGVASRLAASSNQVGNVIEWVLHLPARGSLFVSLDPTAADGGRVGELRAGTREFDKIVGRLQERWVAKTAGEDELSAGRIELLASFVSSDPGDVEEEL